MVHNCVPWAKPKLCGSMRCRRYTFSWLDKRAPPTQWEQNTSPRERHLSRPTTKDATWTNARWWRMQSPAPGTCTWRRGHQISSESVQDTDIISVDERQAVATARRWSCNADLFSKTDKITALKKNSYGSGFVTNLHGFFVFR